MAAMLVAATAGSALAQGTTALRTKGIEVDTLLAKAASPNGVRVIVTLSGATSGAQSLSLQSASAAQDARPTTSGLLRDGQSATAEQVQVLVTHVNGDESKRQRWAPRLIRNTPYMAVTVNRAELDALAADPSVVSIHEDGEQRANLQDTVPLIGMGPAYNAGATGANTMVAILDTGVDFNHVFLSGRVTHMTCFSGNGTTATSVCPNGQTTQYGGNAALYCEYPGCNHGTHVAGIAAGNRAAGTPRNGVAKGANIFAVQVFTRRPDNSGAGAYDSDILAGLNDLLGRIDGELSTFHLTSINMSIGDGNSLFTGNCDTGRGAPFKTAIDALRTKNVATVIAAGNDFQENRMSFPGCISSAVSVANSTKADGVSDSSNISATTDLIAPGTNILSSVPGNAFGSMTGTSMAAPHVTGAFAAIRSACAGATVTQIENALKNTGTPVTDNRTGGTVHWTKPRIRVDLALQALGCGGATGTPAAMTTPPPGSTLPGASVTFGWNAGSGVTEYWLEAGTTAGGNDLFSASTGTNLSATVNSLPTNGSTLYVRLWSQISGNWRFNDYTYTAATIVKAVMTTPTPGSTLPGASVTFGWTAGSGVTQYWLYVGTTQGGSDLFTASTATNRSATVGNLPTDRRTIHVRLWSQIAGAWQFNDYTYTAAAPVVQKPELTTPTPGATLLAATVTFGWTAGTGVTQYWLYVGTTQGGSDLFTASAGTNQSIAVNHLPTDGRLIFVRLWSQIAGAWQFNDYGYFAGPRAAMLSPAPQAVLTSNAVTFEWSIGHGVSQYWLSVGTTAGGSDLYNQTTGTALSAAVAGLPTDGRTIYVRLWSMVDDSWEFNDYTYTSVGGGQSRPVLTTPAPGATLSGASATFGWTAGAGVTEYWLYVGSSSAGLDLYNASTGTNLAATLNNLPTDGRTLYIRLWSKVASGWRFNDYTYRAR